MALLVLVAVALGAFAFVIEVVQPGRESQPTPGTLLTSASNFGISGNVTNLVPGLGTTLTLTVSNPSSGAITLTSVAVSVSTVPPACPVSNLTLNGSAFTGTPPTVTLSGLSQSVPGNGSVNVPVPILLVRAAPNACQVVTFPFTYSGTANVGNGACITFDDDNVVVSKGQSVCITGHVEGEVIVQGGGSLFTSGATIDHGISSSGAASLTICGTNVKDDGIKASGSAGFVEIGDGGDDGAPPCPGNTVVDGIALTTNKAGFEVAANAVTLGPATVTGNTGSGPAGENSKPEIEGNHLSSLGCSGNSPAPTDGGQVNHVTGSKTGQCAGAGF